MKKLHRLIVVFAIALGIAAPAAEHNKIAPPAPAFDLRDEIAAPVQTLPMFGGTSAFDEVAHPCLRHRSPTSSRVASMPQTSNRLPSWPSSRRPLAENSR